MIIKRWILKELNQERALNISEALNIPPFLASLLDVRSLSDTQEIKNFLANRERFSDPFAIKDMQKAVTRIKKALDSFEKICVYGDYDADGVASTALLYSYLETKEANAIYHIPDRKDSGYGLNKAAIKDLKDQDVDLIITVDNGISAKEEIDFANKLGIDTIITDHHRPPEVLPKAVAIVDPHQKDCPSKFKDFSGVGLAFKLICAIENNRDRMDDLIENYLDLVAIGTIADVVPLISENRTLAKIGLKVLSRAKRPALRAIMDEACLLGKSVTSQDVAFVLAPRINSCGRLASAEELVKLLLSKKAEDVTYLANYLGKQNALRKTIENKIIDQVEDFINQNKSLVFEPIIIVFGEKWHTGIIGIVAARFVEKYGKPCIVISTEKSKARASGRSVAGFSLHEAVAHCSEFLTRFGGHPMAVGFEMKTANISKFLQKIFTFARQPEKAPQPLSLTLDCKLNPEALSLDLCDQIHKLEPFGTANPEPLFGIFNMQLTKICPVGGGKHLRLLLQKNEKELTCMKFCTSIDEFGYIEGDTVDIAFNLKESKYLGKKKISIFIRDIRFSALNTEKMLQERRTYESIYRGDCFYPLPPGFDVTRENVVSVYRYLKNCKTWTFPIETLYLRLKNEQISYLQLHYIIDIMHELDLLTLTFKNGDLHITLKNNDNKKMDLSSSRTFQKMKS